MSRVVLIRLQYWMLTQTVRVVHKTLSTWKKQRTEDLPVDLHTTYRVGPKNIMSEARHLSSWRFPGVGSLIIYGHTHTLLWTTYTVLVLGQSTMFDTATCIADDVDATPRQTHRHVDVGTSRAINNYHWRASRCILRLSKHDTGAAVVNLCYSTHTSILRFSPSVPLWRELAFAVGFVGFKISARKKAAQSTFLRSGAICRIPPGRRELSAGLASTLQTPDALDALLFTCGSSLF